MPLSVIEPPEEIRLAAAAHVQRVATLSGGVPALREVQFENLSLVAPHRVFTLGLDAITTAERLEPYSTGWRFLVAHNDTIVASVEVAEDEMRSSSVNGGAYVESTARAITDLEATPDIRDGEFELRLLKVPALYIVAGWLVDQRRLVVPLAPAPPYLETGHPYEEASFLAELRKPAAQVAELDDGLSGG